MTETYKCACCGGTFETDWTDEEAKEEARNTFGDPPISAMAIVCDDCYQRMTPIPTSFLPQRATKDEFAEINSLALVLTLLLTENHSKQPPEEADTPVTKNPQLNQRFASHRRLVLHPGLRAISFRKVF